ncbi:MAG: HPF/RaiA family ribosome-associated protein [Methylophilus sp.]|jgi:ribosomal subunit interface protein
MQTDIKTQGFTLTESIRQYTERRLQYGVSFANDNIQRVTVNLSDINGPRGGEDKRCQILITMPHMPSVVIEDTESNLYVAIDRAVERASRALTRQLGKKNSFSHEGISKFAS